MVDLSKLDSKEKRKLEKVIKIVRDGDIAIAEYLFELEEKFDEAVPATNSLLSKIKGDKGENGEEGDCGKDGKDGRDGTDGKNGKDGKNGLNGKNGTDGKDGENGKDGLNGHDGTDGKDGSPDKPEEIATKLNTLTGVLDRKVIKDLDESFQSIETRIGNLSGGVSNARIQQAFKYILKTEQPTGAIDGANTTYRVTQTIFAVLAFSLNGEVIAQLPNYTIKGNTLIFSSALPSIYSGKDFEIKYV